VIDSYVSFVNIPVAIENSLQKHPQISYGERRTACMMTEQAAKPHFYVPIFIGDPAILWETAHGSPQKTPG